MRLPFSLDPVDMAALCACVIVGLCGWLLCAHGHGVVRLCGCVDVGLCVGCADVGMWGWGVVWSCGCVVVWPCGCVVVRPCGSMLVTEATLKHPEDPASEDLEEWS